jgi:hypothetical protein
VAHEPGQDDLRRDTLETMRSDVVAHVSSLPPSERTRVVGMVDATLARIDAELARLADDGEPRPAGHN